MYFSLSDYVFSAVIAFRSKCSIIKEALLALVHVVLNWAC